MTIDISTTERKLLIINICFQKVHISREVGWYIKIKFLMVYCHSTIKINYCALKNIYHGDKKEWKPPNSICLQECLLTLKVTSPIFKKDDTFGIPVTVKDYGKNDTSIGTSDQYAYRSSFGHVTVLVCFIVIKVVLLI